MDCSLMLFLTKVLVHVIALHGTFRIKIAGLVAVFVFVES